MSVEDDDGCWLWEPGCLMERGVSGVLTNSVENLAEYVVEAMGQAVAAMSSMWVVIGNVDLTTGEGNAPAHVPPTVLRLGIVEVLGWVVWVSLGICVLSIIALGAMMALQSRRGEGGTHLSRIGLVLVAVVLISGASAIVAALLPQGPRDGSDVVMWLQSSLWWYMGAAAVLSVIVGAAKMAWEQRAEPGKDLLRSLITLVVVAGAGVTAIGFLVAGADNFAWWVINESLVDGDFASNLDSMLALSSAGGVAPVGPIIAILLGFCAIICSFVQIVLMVVRSGMIVILAGVLPLAASFTNTAWGKQWFLKACAWLAAFVLYKPAAAIVYAAAFRLVGTETGTGLFGFGADGSGLYPVLVGITMMALAIVAMPALMRFCVPIVGAMAGGGAGAALAGAGLGALPSGAMKVGESLASRSSAGDWEGQAPPSEPSGAEQSSADRAGADGGHSGSGAEREGQPDGAQGADQQGGAEGQTEGTDAQGVGANGATTGGQAAEGASETAGATSTAPGAGTGAAAGASGAAAAAGPAAAVIGPVIEAGKAAHGVAKGAAEDSTGEGGGPSGSR